MAPATAEIELCWRNGCPAVDSSSLSVALQRLIQLAVSGEPVYGQSACHHPDMDEIERRLVHFDSDRQLARKLVDLLQDIKQNRSMADRAPGGPLARLGAKMEDMRLAAQRGGFVRDEDGDFSKDSFHEMTLALDDVERERLRKYADLVSTIEQSSMPQSTKDAYIEASKQSDAIATTHFHASWAGLRIWVSGQVTFSSIRCPLTLLNPDSLRSFPQNSRPRREYPIEALGVHGPRQRALSCS